MPRNPVDTTTRIPKNYDPADKPVRESNPKYPHVHPSKIYKPSRIGDRAVYSMSTKFRVHAEDYFHTTVDVMQKIYISISYSQLKEFKWLLTRTSCSARWIASKKMWAIDSLNRIVLRQLCSYDYTDMYDQNEKTIPIATLELYMRPIFNYVLSKNYDPFAEGYTNITLKEQAKELANDTDIELDDIEVTDSSDDDIDPTPEEISERDEYLACAEYK